MKLTLRAKLTMVYCAIFFASIAVVESGVYWGVRTAFDSILNRDIQTRRAVVEEYVQNHVQRVAWPQLSVALGDHRGFHPEWIEIRDEAGAILFQGQSIREALHGDTSEPSHILKENRWIHKRSYTFTTGMDSSLASGVLDQLRLLMLVTSPLILILASAAGYWIAGRALAPVAEIGCAARSIGASNLGTRIEVPPTGDELQDLAETINNMLTRIDAGFKQVSQFTANASHELRTPLAIIRSTAEVALLHPLDEESTDRTALRRIHRESERSASMLDDMLRLARLEAGTDMLKRQRIDLNQSAREVARNLQVLAEKKGLRMQISVHHEPVWIDADEDHLRRLWTILLENALQYTPAGGHISIGVSRDGAHAVCTIQDTGVGISEGDLPHIFDRFYRADKARGRGSGAGLGLSLARQITGAHGAAIEARSELGKGTVFAVRFDTVTPATAGKAAAPVHLKSA